MGMKLNNRAYTACDLLNLNPFKRDIPMSSVKLTSKYITNNNRLFCIISQA